MRNYMLYKEALATKKFTFIRTEELADLRTQLEAANEDAARLAAELEIIDPGYICLRHHYERISVKCEICGSETISPCGEMDEYPQNNERMLK